MKPKITAYWIHPKQCMRWHEHVPIASGKFLLVGIGLNQCSHVYESKLEATARGWKTKNNKV